jgi:hypothetical protein
MAKGQQLSMSKNWNLLPIAKKKTRKKLVMKPFQNKVVR